MNHRAQLVLNTLLDRQPMAVVQQRRNMKDHGWSNSIFSYSYLCTQNAASGETIRPGGTSTSSSSVTQCPVVAAFYENITTPWSADKYIRLCSTVATSRTSSGQRKRVVYTSTSNQLFVHVVNVTEAHEVHDHVLLRYDGLNLM